MPNTVITIKNLAAVERAYKSAPAIFLEEGRDLISRSVAVLSRIIQNDPWRVGMSGGGAPVRTGNLRESHRTDYFDWKAVIGPNEVQAPYAGVVHEGRPWLDYAAKTGRPDIDLLAADMLRRIADRIADKA